MIRNLLKRLSLSIRLGRMNAKLGRLNRSRLRSLREIRDRREEFAQWEERLRELVSNTEATLLSAKELHDQYKVEIDSIRRELLVMQSTEEALIAANQSLLSRWRAEIAIQVRRQGLTRENTE